MYGPTDPIRGQLTLTESGGLEQPKNIITSLYGARAIYQKYRVDHLPRIALYAMIEGLVEGNPPYNPVELDKAGYGYLANFNSLDANSLLERSTLGYFNLLFEAENIATFKLRWPDYPNASVEDLEDTIAYHFNRVVREWQSFGTQFNTLVEQLVKFGVSPAIWSDQKDWHWTTIELSRFFVEDQALTDLDKMTSLAVESVFTVQYLYNIYEEFKDKPEETSWDLKQLELFLLNRANTFFKSQGEIIDMMDLQRRRQNLDRMMDAFFSDGVRLVSLLQKEYDGPFTHMIFDRVFDGNGFLFKYDRQYTSLQDFLVLFTASPGKFTIHSNRGVGHKVFSLGQIIMQSDCSIADAIRMGATPMFSSPAAGSRDLEQLTFIPGAPINIGTMQFQQNMMSANIQQMIAGSQYFLAKANYNLANSGDDPSIPDKSQGSIAPVQAKLQSYKEMGVQKNRANHFYSRLDWIMRGMFLKMLFAEPGDMGYEEAKDFIDSCIEDGVPQEVFKTKGPSDKPKIPKHFQVFATRVAGAGSTMGRLMALEAVTPYAQTFSAKGQRELSRQAVIAAYGPEAVKDFLPPSDSVDAISNGATVATLENNSMMNGLAVTFSPDNDQKAHIGVHMALGNHLIQNVTQQKMTPIDADKAFEVLIPHLAEHINDIKENPFLKPFFDGIKKSWDQLQEYARLNKVNAEKQIEAQIKQQKQAQAQQQTVMSDAQRKDFVAQADVARADKKVEAQNKRADQANQTRGQIMQEKTSLDAENKRTKTVLDHQAKMENNSVTELQSQLQDMAGQTPSPSDIESNGQTVT